MEKDYMKLIYKTAWSFQKTTGIDFDEFVSIGLVTWAKCLKKYETSKNILFYTYLQRALHNDFSLVYKMTQRKWALNEKIRAVPKTEIPKMERLYDFKEKLNNLSEIAQKIVLAIFNGEIGNSKTLRKYHIKKHFRKMGHTHLRIQQCFDEIKTIL